jgi:DNA ligase-1
MRHLSEGETMEVQGSGKNPYIIKNSGGVISCSCPAWRNQSLAIDVRTCKHIKANVSNGAAPSVQSGSVVAAMVAAEASPSDTAMPVLSSAAPTPAPTPKNVPPCLLAHSWDGETDVSGWLSSYKLDGVRAWWDGEKFWSRLGNQYHAPQWFKDLMPKGVILDGELFAGNGRFQETVSIVRKLNPVDSEWKNIKFMVFDMPKHGGPFEDRILALAKLIREEYQGYYVSKDERNCHIDILEHDHVKDNKHAREWHLALAEKYGYEGIMLRKPGSMYEEGRSHTLLKVKSFKDCEVTVTGYEKGKGKHKGRTGALVCKMDDGTQVSVGTGLTDKERENPPSIGSKITVRYQELTKDGVPRFPSFVSARDYE